MAETARQRQKRQTRERILESARNLMAGGRGLDSLGLREVARESSLAATSLYNHFPDMEALGLALIDSCCFRLRSAMEYERRSMSWSDGFPVTLRRTAMIFACWCSSVWAAMIATG